MMSKTRRWSDEIVVVAAISVILNVLFAINYYYYKYDVSSRNSSNELPRLSWSRRAAAEAEAAASLNCSGHGRAYLDGLVVDGIPTCECHMCYAGPDCSQFNPLCDANADEGDPLFLEPFWMEHAESSAVLVAGWHRMSYNFQDMTTISKELERLIRILHKTLGNALTDGKFLLFGTGSTQLLAAAVNALSHNSSSSAQVVAAVPYYDLYEMQVELFDSRESTFEGDANSWKNNSDTTSTVIEFVTSPNNPDGQMNEAVFNGSNVKIINDRAYYSPHFTAIPAPDDGDLTIFTISKLTGHAGSRFGWALVRDQEVYERMKRFVEFNSIGVSRDSQLRALKLLRVVLEDGGREIFDFGYKTMKKRWERLRDTFALSDRFTLQKIPPQYCNFLHKVREPTPAYAWVKCEKEESMSCYEVMRSGNITGREGSIFRADNRYVRLSLIRSQDDFDTLIHHLRRLLLTNTKKEEEKFATY